MSVIMKQDGDDLVWEGLDRSTGGARTEALRMTTAGLVKVNGVTLGPYSLQAAFTQTAYSTTDRTVAAVTSHSISDGSTGVASTSALAPVTEVSAAGSADTAPVQNNFATLAAELALTKADLLSVKKNLNAIIDSLQAVGIVG